MTNHVSDAEIQTYIDGTLPTSEHAVVERHLDECQDCMRRLAAWGDRIAEELAIGGSNGSTSHGLPPDFESRLRRLSEGGAAAPPGERTLVSTELVLAKTSENKEKRVGEGGVGTVFEYTDTRFGRPVAIKVLKQGVTAAASQAARFRREMELTACIDHPGCPTVYGSGTTDDGRDFYWMQLITGQTLKEKVAEFHSEGRVTLKRFNDRFRILLALLRDVCHVINAAHKRGIIHRDLKPQNICVHHDGRPVVLDWGMAKRRDSEDLADDGNSPDTTRADATREGVVMGTLLYMAPEQARADRHAITDRTDIFGLGSILHEILTGHPPHARLAEQFTSQQEMLQAIGRSNRVDLPGVPRELASICRKALAAVPETRYASPTELADDVDRWLAGLQVSAHHYSLPERGGVAVRRRPLGFLLGSIASLMLVTAGVATVSFAVQADNQRHLAERRFQSALTAWKNVAQDVQDELALEGNTGLAREKLLNRAISGIESLASEARDQPGAELVAMEARLELAHLERRERKKSRVARELYTRIAADLRSVKPSGESVLQFRKLVADAEKGVAQCVLDIDGVAAAQPLFNAWHREVQRFYEDFSEEPVAAMALCQSHVWQGRLARDRGPQEWPQAEKHFQTAQEVIERAKPPVEKADIYLYEGLLAKSERATSLRDQNRTAEAIALQREVVEAMKALSERQPTRRNRMSVVEDQMNLGISFINHGDHETARDVLLQTLELAEKLAAEFSNDGGVRHLQWLVQYNLATVHRTLGHPARALEVLEDYALRPTDFDLARTEVDVLDDQATANGAMARAYEDVKNDAAASERYRMAVQFRSEILRRDAANKYNLSQLLVAARKTCMLARAVDDKRSIADSIQSVCRQVDAVQLDKKDAAHLLDELAGVYFFLGLVQQAIPVEQDQAAEELTWLRHAAESYEQAIRLLKSIDEQNQAKLASVEEPLNECKRRIREIEQRR